MSEIWPLVPNWTNGVKETYEFKTEVITSRSGKEQRRALRTTPRRTVSYSALADGTLRQRAVAALVKSRGDAVLMGDPIRKVRTTSAIPVGSSAATLRSVPPWLLVGMTVGVTHRRQVEVFTVSGRMGNQVTLSPPSARAFPAGANLTPMIKAWFSKSTAFDTVTDSVAVVPVNVDLDLDPVNPQDPSPLEQPGPGNVAPGASSWLGGREILTVRPNWSRAPSVTYANSAETVDYGRGRIARTFPVDFASIAHQFGFTAMQAADAHYVVDFFRRKKGRRGDFYIPTWTDDLTPISNIGATSFTVEGRAVFDAYAGDTVHKAILILTKDGGAVPYLLNGISLSGGNTRLTYDGSGTIPLENVRRICWMPVARFASDTLTVDWTTEAVAQIAVNAQSLEWTEPEYLWSEVPRLVEEGDFRFTEEDRFRIVSLRGSL